MKYVLMIYQGPTPTLPGSDGWKALPEEEQKAIYADYAATNIAAGVTPGLPLGLPTAAKTVQVRDGKPPREERDLSGRGRGWVYGARS
jgi:hypothetical protein